MNSSDRGSTAASKCLLEIRWSLQHFNRVFRSLNERWLEASSPVCVFAGRFVVRPSPPPGPLSVFLASDRARRSYSASQPSSFRTDSGSRSFRGSSDGWTHASSRSIEWRTRPMTSGITPSRTRRSSSCSRIARTFGRYFNCSRFQANRWRSSQRCLLYVGSTSWRRVRRMTSILSSERRYSMNSVRLLSGRSVTFPIELWLTLLGKSTMVIDYLIEIGSGYSCFVWLTYLLDFFKYLFCLLAVDSSWFE